MPGGVEQVGQEPALRGDEFQFAVDQRAGVEELEGGWGDELLRISTCIMICDLQNPALAAVVASATPFHFIKSPPLIFI